MSNSMKILAAGAIICVIVVAFGAGFWVRARMSPEYPEGIDKVAEVWNIVQNGYVDQGKVASDNLTQAAIQGIVDYLDDPYTAYLDATSYELFGSRLQGDFEGIGAYVSVLEGRIVIVAPIPGSPAESAGIVAGDTILSVDGTSVEGMSLTEAIFLIRGEEGTSVTLTVLHPEASQPVDISITRAKIEVPSVLLEMQGDIAHVTITQFSSTTADELTPVIQQINDDPDIRGIVLDLRGNGGGLLDAVIKVASHFITEGVIVSVRDNAGIIDSLSAEDVGPTTDLPMVCLVDESSASGSEVLAGALQDYNRAVIAGNTTFGKGSVNTLYDLGDGSGLYLTIARWITPDGRIIEGQGIEPDIKLDMTGQDAVAWAVGYLTDLE